jgi:hypothetical protein
MFRNQIKGVVLKVSEMKWIQNFTPPTEAYNEMKKKTSLDGIDYKFYSTKSGRAVYRRVGRLKRQIMFLYCVIIALAAFSGLLCCYICSILNRG